MRQEAEEKARKAEELKEKARMAKEKAEEPGATQEQKDEAERLRREAIEAEKAASIFHYILLLTSYVSVRSYAFARIFSFASVLAWNIYQYSNANIQSLFALLSMRCIDVRRAMTIGIAHRAHYTVAQSCMCNHIGCS